MRKFVLVATGNLIDGFTFYGPTSQTSGHLEGYTRRLTDIGEDWWLTPLHPLPIIVEESPAPGAARATPGVHFTVHTAGSRGRSHFAVIDRELVETVEEKSNGTPDWENGGICDPCRGDEDFFYPALALLRFLDSSAHDTPTWHYLDRERVEPELATYAERKLIAAWQRHPASGGYAVDAHGTSNDVVLRTPMEADAFVAALSSAAHSGQNEPTATGARQPS